MALPRGGNNWRHVRGQHRKSASNWATARSPVGHGGKRFDPKALDGRLSDVLSLH